MNKEHVISDEALETIVSGLEHSFHWLAYNTLSYFLDKDDIRLFKAENQADEWAFENNSKTEAYRTIHIKSLTDLFTQIKYGKRLDTLLNQSKNSFMNLQNLDYLKENLRLMGFGDKLHADLEKNIGQGFPEFVLKMQSEFNKEKMDTILFFKKSEQSDMYFFNRFDAHLHHKNDPEKDRQQTFFLNKGHGVTLKEAFNLLEGRAVFKELSNKEGKYHAWIQLDFKEKETNGNNKMKQYHQNYGYDLAGTLKTFPIKELQNEQQRERLMMSLQKGNIQSVTMTAGGREQMFFVQANPQYKTITVYDAHMKMLGKEQRTELLEKGAVRNEHVNDRQIKTSKQEQNKEAATEQVTPDMKKSESLKKDKEKSKGQKSSEASESNKSKKEKKETVKNLLPQKESTGSKKGLRA
jgi:hypothetical protein